MTKNLNLFIFKYCIFTVQDITRLNFCVWWFLNFYISDYYFNIWKNVFENLKLIGRIIGGEDREKQ